MTGDDMDWHSGWHSDWEPGDEQTESDAFPAWSGDDDDDDDDDGRADAKRAGGRRAASAPIVFGYRVYTPLTDVPEPKDLFEALFDAISAEPVPAQALAVIKQDLWRLFPVTREESPELFEIDPGFLNQRGLTQSDRATLKQAEIAFDVVYEGPIQNEHAHVMALATLAVGIADALDGVIQDVESYTNWNRREFRAATIESLPELQIQSFVTMHAESGDEYDGVWVHTHGLLRFGVPELEIVDVPRVVVRTAGLLIQEIAEDLVEGCDYEVGDTLGPEDGPKLRFAPAARLGDLKPEMHYGGPCLRLVDAQSAHPEFSETLVIFLDHYELYQREQAVVVLAHDDEVSAAHERAVAALPKIKRLFQALTAPERTDAELLIKVPFAVTEPDDEDFDDADRDDDDAPANEYMWVQVDDWDGTTLTGRLDSDPLWRNDLSRGDALKVDEGEIFDWIFSPDPRQESAGVQGNFLEDILSRRQEEDAAEQGEDSPFASIRRLLHRGEFERARRRAEVLIETHAKDAEAQFLVGETYAALGLDEAALGPYTRATKLAPEVAVAWLRLGMAHEGVGALGRAIACYERAVELDPEDADGLALLGSAHWTAGDLDAAEAVLGRAADHDPTIPQYGALLLARGRYTEAADAIRRGLDADSGDPGSSALHGLAACLHAAHGEITAAASAYGEALGSDPEDCGHWISLAECEREAGDAEAAVVALAMAAVLDGANAVRAVLELAPALRAVAKSDESLRQRLWGPAGQGDAGDGKNGGVAPDAPSSNTSAP